ncbi:hypothetical protein [Clostridioides difficile]|uniref:hypothetical protein n=2 Tax=Clostridioides difficile TaxID=1496 RepID=UPI003556748D
MDNIIIREMVDDERRFVWELGKSSFGLVESLAFRKPKKLLLLLDSICGVHQHKRVTHELNN